VITGYATIESAVETMRDGAVDYVQKPFTADELVTFVRKLLLKREARLAAQRQPHVRVIAPGERGGADEFCIPGGAFLSEGHAWARIETSGRVRVGLDDFAARALGSIERLDLPPGGATVKEGEPLFTMRRGGVAVPVLAPLSGKVVELNSELAARPSSVGDDPYDAGWVCEIEPADLVAELTALRIGKPAIDWYQAEVVRLRQMGGAGQGSAALDWGTLQKEFLARRAGG
jgi:glycine cleavage system H lipoate-binding protein